GGVAGEGGVVARGGGGGSGGGEPADLEGEGVPQCVAGIRDRDSAGGDGGVELNASGDGGAGGAQGDRGVHLVAGGEGEGPGAEDECAAGVGGFGDETGCRVRLARVLFDDECGGADPGAVAGGVASEDPFGVGPTGECCYSSGPDDE